MTSVEKEGFFKNLRYDLPASLVVFVVALPLCLGIALASGAGDLGIPIFSGLIAGICGGLIAGAISGSSLAVSGPAAGLTTIVYAAIETLGFEAFLMAVVLSGIMQIVFGYLKAGVIGNFFPVSVIKGMLSAIGLTLILKQIPHALGWDADPEGDMSFVQPDGENTFSELGQAFAHISTGAVVISLISLAILILWERPSLKKYTFIKLVPATLLVVFLGIILNGVFASIQPQWVLTGDHLVDLNVSTTFEEFTSQFTLPDFNAIFLPGVWVTAFTICLVASLETLLSIEATDKMDPFKRSTPLNRELKAQGAGNLVSGLIGGLPITAVIVRSSANISSGARTKTSTVLHGFFLLSTVALIPQYLNLIPLSSLAAILLMVGYKLAKPVLFKQMFNNGLDQFLPFIITIIAVLLTNLLVGIGIGMVVGFYFVFRNNYHTALQLIHKRDHYLLRLEKDVSFLNKASIRKTLDSLPENTRVVINGERSEFIDHDVIEMLEDYQSLAKHKGIIVELVEINSKPLPEINISKKRSAQVAPAREAKNSEQSEVA
ncbi:MAG TPA: hypothetical protein DCE41_10380 [Cytophagales bacterium]|nr:hypothetical protein [Cytophagales bacterium]HAA20120.1 hypothetical protein [Cytophagales bacterium]HAP64073.1 hypothetical protein [Cytophagales bacterium]